MEHKLWPEWVSPIAGGFVMSLGLTGTGLAIAGYLSIGGPLLLFVLGVLAVLGIVALIRDITGTI